MSRLPRVLAAFALASALTAAFVWSVVTICRFAQWAALEIARAAR